MISAQGKMREEGSWGAAGQGSAEKRAAVVPPRSKHQQAHTTPTAAAAAAQAAAAAALTCGGVKLLGVRHALVGAGLEGSVQTLQAGSSSAGELQLGASVF